MLNVSKQLKLCSLQLRDCFNKQKLPFCILVFIFTGMAVLWLFIVQAIMLLVVRLLQIPSQGIDSFIKNKNNEVQIRLALLFVSYPIALLGYVVVPIFYMVIWSLQFLFNCFAFITSIGRATWTALQFD